ncbi:MAG: TerD family protein [Alphaproteobacteria bacterium]
MTNFKPLNVTQEAAHRIFVGLGWDPNDSPSLRDKIGALIRKRASHHDLDLSCFYYDADGKALGYVTAAPEHYSNATHSIYHSGDDSEGIGDGDDEQISVELKNLPDNVYHLVFKASIKSGHNFDEIKEARVRLCDGYTERVFEDVGIHSDMNAFVFLHLTKDNGQWRYVRIDRYLNNDTPDKIGDIIAKNVIPLP